MSSDHDHDHESDHGGGGHSHGVSANADRRWLTVALGLIVGFMVIEVTVGLIAHSLALLSDAAHMLTDAASIVLALIAIRLAARPARGTFTYGLQRAEIMSALANGVTLLVLSAWLTVEAIQRLVSPPPVTGGLVLVTALLGVVVNIAAAWAISKANRTSLNVEGAFQHIITDLYGFIATAIAGLVVVTTGYARADAIASLVVVVLMVKAGIGLVRESGLIFLEAAPAGADPDQIGDRIVSVEGVDEVHDLHVWTITSGKVALSAHVLVEPGRDCHGLRRDIEQILSRYHNMTHTTLQVDHAPSRDAPEHVPFGGTALPVIDEHCEDALALSTATNPTPH